LYLAGLAGGKNMANLLVGTWKLLSAFAIGADGRIDSEVYGADPMGYITYTPEGHMMVMFSRRDRSPFSQEVRSPFSPEIHALPIQELALALTTFNAYAGTYTLSGNTVVHQIEIASIPNRVNTSLIRTWF
jgi:hypothetical protein